MLRRDGVSARFVTPDSYVWRAVDSIAAEPLLNKWVGLIEPSDVVYDIGAHYGVYSVFAACRGARVIAFEPDPARHNVFQANVEANGLTGAVALVGVALSDHDGTATLYQGTGVAALDVVASEGYAGTPSFSVPIARGDDYVTSQGWARPTVLKIDVEGYESAVLDGLASLLSGVRLISCEIHPDRLMAPETVQSVIARLTRVGLQVVAKRGYQHEHHVLASRSG